MQISFPYTLEEEKIGRSESIHTQLPKYSILFLSILLIRNQFRVYREKVLIQFMLLLPLFNDSRLFSMFKRSLSNTQKPIFLNLFSSSPPPSSLLPSTIKKDPYTQKCHFHSKRYECKINAKSNDENAELLLK